MLLLPWLPLLTFFGPRGRCENDVHRLGDSFGVGRQDILVAASLPRGLQDRSIRVLFPPVRLELVPGMVVGMVTFGASMRIRVEYVDALLDQWPEGGERSGDDDDVHFGAVSRTVGVIESLNGSILAWTTHVYQIIRDDASSKMGPVSSFPS